MPLFKRLLRPRESKSQSPRPAPSPLIPQPSLVAPQDLPAQLSQTNIGPEPTTSNTQASPAPIGKGDNYGAIELFSGGTKATVDIVFVHGLTGNSYNTWFHEEAKVHWPSQLLSQDIPDARILSFGYDADIVNFWNPASNSRLSNHAETMVDELARKRSRTSTESRKIIFVAHSLGGLVTERAISHSRTAVDEYHSQIERCTVGIVFLGVPLCGADLASWATFGTQMVSILRRTNKDIVKVLTPGSEMLREVQTGFHNVLEHRKIERSAISITCFYEQLPVTGVGEIVPLHSAEMQGYPCLGIRANHMNMTKFPDDQDRGYDSILGVLQRWKKASDNTGASNSLVAQLQANPNDAVFNPKVTASPDSRNHHWLVPRSASRVYTGRRELGERLAQSFSFKPLKPQIQQRIFVITGIGGTGKSEACLKFAEDHQHEYWGVFWLDATSIATAEQGYVDIGRQCNVPQPNVSNVKSWLAGDRQPWLLIIDNADNPEIDYSDYLPSGKRGDILLTTRNPDYVTYNTVGVEKMGDLKPEQARELLLRTADIEKSRWEEKENAAMAVVNTLGSHTLAIIQAGAFIKKKLCTLEGYPEVFQQQKGQLLKRHSKQNMSKYRNVYTTFEVSAEYLQNSESPECSDALDLLHIFAFMHNSEISETIFHRASEYALELKDMRTSNDYAISLSVHHIARLPRYIQPGWSNSQDRFQWREACNVLASLSIITQHGDDDSIIISAHSLVHAWAQERQDDQSRCRAWQSAATIIALSCQGWYQYCPFYILIQSHVRACVYHDIENYTQDMSDMEAAQVLIQLAYVLKAMRDDSSLDFLVQGMCSRLQNRFKANHQITLQIKNFTGRIFGRQGKFVEAVNIFEEIVETRSQALAEDHPDRLASQHTLARAYQANGQVGEAVKLLEHVVKIQKKWPEIHPGRIASQHTLADAYRANGQVGDAVKLLEYVVKMHKMWPQDYPDRLASQNALARAYLANGQVGEAIKLLEHVVKIQETLAEDRPDRLTSQNALAGAYRSNGQVGDALKLVEHVAKVREKLAEDHPDRLASQHELACAYQENGQVGDALKLLEHVVKIQEKLAEDHPDRLAFQHELACAYLANGQVGEAVKLLEHVVKIQEKLAEDHPFRLASQHELARAYLANGQVGEAVKLLEHVVKIRGNMAEDHPERLVSQQVLANAYQANGQVGEAVKLLEHVVKIQEKLAEDHPDRLASQHDLADAYKENGQVSDAVKVLEHVVKIDEQLAEDHPARLDSQHALALAYRENGQVGDAVKLFEHVVKIEEKLAEDHPNRLTSQHTLAIAYRENGQVGDAVKLLEHVVKIQEKLAEDHPDRLASQHALAKTYQANMQVGEAVKLFEHIVQIEEKLAEDHPDRITTLRALARAYEANGQLDEAAVRFEQVRTRERKTPSPNQNSD